MSIRDLYDKHHDELTVRSRTLIETTDDRTLDMFGDFDNANDFNMFSIEFEQ